MRYHFLLGFCLSFTVLISFTASANNSFGFPAEENFVTSMRQHQPDFRIVKKPETFPERYNANIPLNITTSTSDGERDVKALLTLHDGTTGEPMESCYAPCVLHKSQGRPAYVMAYRLGYYPMPVSIDDPDIMAAEEPYWDGQYEISLGINFFEARLKAKACEREFAQMPRDDADTTPCFRMPPMVPQVEYSGYCKIAFDVTATGQTINMRPTECTDSAFEFTSLLTVSHWKYHPKIERGVPVLRTDVETTLRYEVTDYDGHLLDQDGNRVDDE